MSPAVDEEGRGAAHGRDVGALDVPVDPGRVSSLGEVAGEPVHVQTELLGVADEVLRVELVLVLEEEVVHLPERPLFGGGLAPFGGLTGVRVDVVERQVAPDIGEVGKFAQQFPDHRFGSAAVRAFEVAVLHHGHGRVDGAPDVVDLGIYRLGEVDQVDPGTEHGAGGGAFRAGGPGPGHNPRP